MPSYVSEGSVAKYNRAVKQLKDEKKDVTEDAVKALYVKFGGLVLGSDEEEVVALEDLGIRDLRKIAKGHNIETEGLEREELIAAIEAA